VTQSAEKPLASSPHRFADFPIAKYNNINTLCIFKAANKPTVHFVYIIVSVPRPDRYYVGLTKSVRQRVGQHNQGIVTLNRPFSALAPANRRLLLQQKSRRRV
jgi:hypothetical protein